MINNPCSKEGIMMIYVYVYNYEVNENKKYKVVFKLLKFIKIFWWLIF